MRFKAKVNSTSGPAWLRSPLGRLKIMRAALKIARFVIAAALFGFGVVIIVGFIGVLLEGPMEEPLWQHLLSVSFMGVLPILGAVLLLFLKIPLPRPQQAAPPNGGPATPIGDSGVREGPPSVS